MNYKYWTNLWLRRIFACYNFKAIVQFCDIDIGHLAGVRVATENKNAHGSSPTNGKQAGLLNEPIIYLYKQRINQIILIDSEIYLTVFSAILFLQILLDELFKT